MSNLRIGEAIFQVWHLYQMAESRVAARQGDTTAEFLMSGPTMNQ